MGIVEAIVYGIVQGLTEFLPISSTAHIRIVPAMLGWDDPGAAFTAVIQIGTLLAVLIYFRKELWQAFRGWIGSFTGSKTGGSQDAMMGWAIVIGTLPIVIFGVAFSDQIKTTLRSLYVISFSLIVMGILLFIAERVGRRVKTEKDVTWKDGLWVGLWQAIALIPGASRSGSTITGALFAGFDRAAAARFSFLLSVPSILAAGLKELYEEREAILGAQLVPVLIATLVSFVVGYWAIDFLIKFLQKRSTTVFVVYRVALGILLLVLLQQGVLSPNEGANRSPSLEGGVGVGEQSHPAPAYAQAIIASETAEQVLAGSVPAGRFRQRNEPSPRRSLRTTSAKRVARGFNLGDGSAVLDRTWPAEFHQAARRLGAASSNWGLGVILPNPSFKGGAFLGAVEAAKCRLHCAIPGCKP